MKMNCNYIDDFIKLREYRSGLYKFQELYMKLNVCINSQIHISYVNLHRIMCSEERVYFFLNICRGIHEDFHVDRILVLRKYKFVSAIFERS